MKTGKQLARFAQGYSLASALVHKGTIYVFASRYDPKTIWNDVTMFSSTDLKKWEKQVVVKQEKNEHLFNSSVCAGPDGFVMAYESNSPQYTSFTTKFAHSKDLKTWSKVPDAVLGKDRYTACPCIRYTNGYYYVLYLEHRSAQRRFETYIARSKDLKSWQLSTMNPVIRPYGTDEGLNTSDVDLIEHKGKTYFYYTVGDQQTWMSTKRAVYPASLSTFLRGWF